MKLIGASFLMLAYASFVGAVYYHTGGDIATTGYVSAITAFSLTAWRIAIVLCRNK